MLTRETPDTFRKRLDDLKTLRDEVRVRLHLGELDARRAWDQFAQRLDDLEEQARRAGDAAVDELDRSLEKLRTSLRHLKARLEQPRH